MLAFLKWLFVGNLCNHEFEPYGTPYGIRNGMIQDLKNRPHGIEAIKQSHRCKKCGTIKVFRV